MYMTFRAVHAAPGRVGEVLEAALRLTALINDRHGADFAVATAVGGNPDVVAVSAGWETLGAYQAVRDAYMADDDLRSEMQSFGALTTGSQDQIGRVLMPPGERAQYSTISQARMHMPRVAEAIPFAFEVSELVEAKVGLKVGVMNASTGDRSQIAWVSRTESLDQIAEVGETLEADPDYLDLFKRSADLFVDGSLEQSIWQRMG